VADDPNDPFPTEEGMGGMAFQRAVTAWEARHPDPPPGPGPAPSATGYSPSGGGASKGTYDLSGFTAGSIAEAEQEATDFAGWLGWPSWFDYNAMVQKILQLDTQSDPQKAYEFLWTQLSPDKQKDHENAYFGLTKQQYTEKLNSLKDMFNLYTGDNAVPDAFRNQALKENWTQSELLTALQKDPHIGETAPWLAAGQTFRDVASQFTGQYGIPQKDKNQLSSWWKFRSGAQSVGSGNLAQQVAPQPSSLVQRQPASDVETR
jgi:hypothetical protein